MPALLSARLARRVFSLEDFRSAAPLAVLAAVGGGAAFASVEDGQHDDRRSAENPRGAAHGRAPRPGRVYHPGMAQRGLEGTPAARLGDIADVVAVRLELPADALGAGFGPLDGMPALARFAGSPWVSGAFARGHGGPPGSRPPGSYPG